MDIKSTMKIDVWWKAVLIIGLLTVACSLIYKVTFIESKHLFGLGLGMILVGIAHWMAWKTVAQFMAGGILQTQVIKHNYASVLILIIGIILIILFGFLIVKELI